MYLAIPTERSCARAWVAAASAIIETDDEGYNVVIDVEDPCRHSARDNAVINLVDRFLREHDKHPIVTVAVRGAFPGEGVVGRVVAGLSEAAPLLRATCACE